MLGHFHDKMLWVLVDVVSALLCWALNYNSAFRFGKCHRISPSLWTPYCCNTNSQRHLVEDQENNYLQTVNNNTNNNNNKNVTVRRVNFFMRLLTHLPKTRGI